MQPSRLWGHIAAAAKVSVNPSKQVILFKPQFHIEHVDMKVKCQFGQFVCFIRSTFSPMWPHKCECQSGVFE